MQLLQVRNATMVVSIGPHRLLVDPMLAPPGTLPGFKIVGGGRRRNPLVPLPPVAAAALEQVTAVLVTHEHPDHLDRAGVAWIRERRLPVWASRIDARSLRRKGLEVEVVRDGLGDLAIEVVPCRHGRGLIGWLLGPVSGFFLAHAQEPSVFLTSDAVLTPHLLDTIDRLQPDVVVAPAGAANFGLGGDILLSIDELVDVVRHAPGRVVLNHLEALDHCRTTRDDLRARLEAEGLVRRVTIPADGETVVLEHRGGTASGSMRSEPPRSRLQKWLTSRMSGT